MDLKTTVLVDTLRFPECPRWHEGTLWCSDFFARRVIQVDLLGGEKTVAALKPSRWMLRVPDCHRERLAGAIMRPGTRFSL